MKSGADDIFNLETHKRIIDNLVKDYKLNEVRVREYYVKHE